jgi:hypothetical protein
MSRRCHWDKVNRDRRAYERGTLPAWWDAWAAGEPWEPAAPSMKPNPPQESKELAERSPDTKPLLLRYVFDRPVNSIEKRSSVSLEGNCLSTLAFGLVR